MAARIALITGLTGQDGSYLREHLGERGYEVHGLIQPGELTDASAVRNSVATIRPDECYHLAAQTVVNGDELSTVQVNVSGTLHVLEALRRERPDCRLFLAGSSEMFGDVDTSPQDETTPFRPRNVYGVSKVAAYELMRVYREQHGLFACCGILYNHESPRRGEQFVTRKITRAAARIKLGQQSELALGNLDAVRDWGHARDYVRAMWLMLQQPRPDDYIVATGRGRTVREFVEAAFAAVDLDWHHYVRVEPEFYRPLENIPFIGNAQKAQRSLDWCPETSLEELVAEMVHSDLQLYGLPTTRPS
jgi:GDPmannose 4,6-dehydratase